MNDLIKITANSQGQQVLSARELHEFLEVIKHMTQWIKPYIDGNNDYGFVEGVDFTRVDGEVNPTNGIPTIDYAITLEMGKELSMLSKSSKGRQARKYFIECEKVAKNLIVNTSQLSPELQMFKQIFDSVAKQQLEQQQIKEEIKETKEEIQGIRDVVAINSTDWRKDTSALISKIALSLGGFEYINKVRNESYGRLETRIPIKLETRLTNKRRRMADEGVCKSKRDKLTKLDVIAEDRRALEVYLAIIKEMAIKNGVGI